MIDCEPEQYEIHPGYGIGRIAFGQSIEEIQKTLGPADEIDQPIDGFLHWDYRTLKLQISFLPSDWPSCTMPMQMFQFVVRHPKATLWGVKLMGRPESEVLAILKEHDFDNFTVSEEMLGAYKYKSLRSEALNLRLEFREEKLRFMVLWKPKITAILPEMNSELVPTN